MRSNRDRYESCVNERDRSKSDAASPRAPRKHEVEWIETAPKCLVHGADGLMNESRVSLHTLRLSLHEPRLSLYELRLRANGLWGANQAAGFA